MNFKMIMRMRENEYKEGILMAYKKSVEEWRKDEVVTKRDSVLLASSGVCVSIKRYWRWQCNKKYAQGVCIY